MSIWQTQSWQDMLIASGQSEEYFIIERDTKSPDSLESGLKRVVFIEKRKISLGKFALFVIGFEGEIDEDLENNLQELCKEEKCIFVQIETLNYTLQPLSLNKGEDIGESFFKNSYYKKFIPPFTAVIDLRKSEEEILAVMKPKGRYNIRLAEKKGLLVEQVDKNPYNAKIFYSLMQETTSRDHFSGNTLSYYQNFLEKIEESQLYFVYYEQQVIAAGIFVFSQDVALYYYGASANMHRNLMAPYLLQWKVIEHAKKRGCTLYDFLGIATPGEQDSALAGVTDFKLKLTPDIREVSQGFLCIEKKFLYTMIQFLRKVRKK